MLPHKVKGLPHGYLVSTPRALVPLALVGDPSGGMLPGAQALTCPHTSGCRWCHSDREEKMQYLHKFGLGQTGSPWGSPPNTRDRRCLLMYL